MISLKQDTKILFIGDSITDCGRNREDDNSLGGGYTHRLAGELQFEYHDIDLKVFNKGISGNRGIDLKNRWEEDCISYNPDILSVYIGINDTWRKFDSNDETSAADFKALYEGLLKDAKEKCGCQIVMIEPFVLPCPEDRREWRTDLDPKIQAVRELAEEYADAYVPLDGLFAQAAFKTKNPEYWAPDGVHPSNAGHALIADAWREATGL